MRLFALSDLHVDFAANLDLVRTLSTETRQDALIVAGDSSHRLDRSEEALSALVERFAQVFFVPGNHDLWVNDGTDETAHATSLQRMEELERLCYKLGVLTEAAVAGDTWVVPLHGWYEPAFAQSRHADAPTDRISRRWADHQRCRWPADLADDAEITRYMIARNEGQPEAPAGRRVVTFSHFLPRPELLPRVANLRFKELPLVSGTTKLDEQLRAMGASTHVFGHTHIPWDETIDGVRYLQNPLSYPHERKRRGQVGIQLVEV